MSLADQPAIHLIDVKKGFEGVPVLKGIDLRVPRGAITVILGGSGMGKSVLLKHMIGLLEPDSGQIFIEGEDTTHFGERQWQQVRRKFGKVFQGAALFDSMSVFDNVAFPLREQTKMKREEIREVVREKLLLFSLDPDAVAHKTPSQLSGGQRKRVALARAVVLEPSIVLYDEPTTGLDPITGQQVDEMILHAKNMLKVTSVVISHDIASAFRIADQLLFIYEGEVVARGQKEDLLSSEHPYVQHFFASMENKKGSDDSPAPVL